MEKFGTSGQTICRIWKRGQNGVLNTDVSCDVSSRKKGICGQKKKWGTENLQAMATFPLHDQLSVCVRSAKTSLWRLLQNGDIKRHNSSLKPLLNDANKRKRLEFPCSFVGEDDVFDAM